MGRFCVLLTLCLGLTSSAEACNRCGIFGRGCRYVAAPVVAQQVVPVAQYKAPEVFVIQNNYPQPNGQAALLAQQGSTVYSYQQLSQAYSQLNPTEQLRQSAELVRAAQSLAATGLNGHTQMVNNALALQSELAAPLVKSQAAVNLLNAAGLSQPLTAPQSLAMKITRDPSGSWKVEQVEAAPLNARVEAKLETRTQSQTGTGPQAPAAPPAPTSILATKCASCHGTNLTEPKGGIFLDTGVTLDCDTILQSIDLVKADKMPKDSKLTNEEKGALLEELLLLRRKRPPGPTE